MTVYGAWLKSQGNLTFTPSPRNSPSAARNSWSGARDVWLEPAFAPYPTFPRPPGQSVAIKSDWWRHPANGPSTHELTSPAATSAFGPTTLAATLACRSTPACSPTTDRSTTARPLTRAPHCTSESVTSDPVSTTAGSPGLLSSVQRQTPAAPSMTAAGPTK